MATVFCKKENVRGIKPERVGYVGELKDNLRNGKRATFFCGKNPPRFQKMSPSSCEVVLNLIFNLCKYSACDIISSHLKR